MKQNGVPSAGVAEHQKQPRERHSSLVAPNSGWQSMRSDKGMSAGHSSPPSDTDESVKQKGTPLYTEQHASPCFGQHSEDGGIAFNYVNVT